MSDEAATRGPTPVRRGAIGEALSPARARLLEHLQQRAADVTVEEVAAEFGQDPNTVRQHLDGLAEAGLVLRARTPGPGRGRPAWRYRANPVLREPDPRVREYVGLAGALAAHLAAHSADPRAEARSAGSRWGRALVDDSAPVSPTGPGEPAAPHQRVVELLAELDFSPRLESPEPTVLLTTCPLLDVATQHPAVVCALHEGLVAGALERLGAPSDGVVLQPFAAPDGCRLTLPGPDGHQDRSGAQLGRAVSPPRTGAGRRSPRRPRPEPGSAGPSESRR